MNKLQNYVIDNEIYELCNNPYKIMELSIVKIDSYIINETNEKKRLLNKGKRVFEKKLKGLKKKSLLDYKIMINKIILDITDKIDTTGNLKKMYIEDSTKSSSEIIIKFNNMLKLFKLKDSKLDRLEDSKLGRLEDSKLGRLEGVKQVGGFEFANLIGRLLLRFPEPDEDYADNVVADNVVAEEEEEDEIIDLFNNQSFMDTFIADTIVPIGKDIFTKLVEQGKKIGGIVRDEVIHQRDILTMISTVFITCILPFTIHCILLYYATVSVGKLNIIAMVNEILLLLGIMIPELIINMGVNMGVGLAVGTAVGKLDTPLIRGIINNIPESLHPIPINDTRDIHDNRDITNLAMGIANVKNFTSVGSFLLLLIMQIGMPVGAELFSKTMTSVGNLLSSDGPAFDAAFNIDRQFNYIIQNTKAFTINSNGIIDIDLIFRTYKGQIDYIFNNLNGLNELLYDARNVFTPAKTYLNNIIAQYAAEQGDNEEEYYHDDRREIYKDHMIRQLYKLKQIMIGRVNSVDDRKFLGFTFNRIREWVISENEKLKNLWIYFLQIISEKRYIEKDIIYPDVLLQ
jgi:hypothetical protein